MTDTPRSECQCPYEDKTAMFFIENWCYKCNAYILTPSSNGEVTAKDFIIQKAKTNPLIKGLETNEAQIDLLNEFASLKLKEQEEKTNKITGLLTEALSRLQSIGQNQNDKLGKVLEWVLGQEHYLAAAYDRSDKKLPMGEYFIDLFDKEFEKEIER